MNNPLSFQNSGSQRPVHSWLHKVTVACAPGPGTTLAADVVARLLDSFSRHGHTVLSDPGDPPGLDVLLTTSEFGVPLSWRESMTFSARRRFKLDKVPLIMNVTHAQPHQWNALVKHFEHALAKEKLDPADFSFPGLTRRAYHTLYEQGRRGGPIMSIVRLVESQAMSVRNIVVVGADRLQYAYTFDLVGAHPRTDASLGEGFYDDLMYRILTAVSTHEITEHEVAGEPIPLSVWRALEAPQAMKAAGLELGRLGFFTEMVRVDYLVAVPLLNQVIASQYSEGCFATWEPELGALVSTITGSARPVVKDSLTDNELAVITAVRPDRKGACVRHVDGLHNDPPSSEAVEMIGVDSALPRVILGDEWPAHCEVPVARSKLHGHRGVRSYDPRFIEHVYLDPPYYFYPVSCSTEAQADAIQAAFSRSEALQNPADPRQVVFTLLPGHGVLILEKWVPGKAPFQVICECMRDGRLEIEDAVPQGPLDFQPGPDGRLVMRNL
jgi:hypothetical protein